MHRGYEEFGRVRLEESLCIPADGGTSLDVSLRENKTIRQCHLLVGCVWRHAFVTPHVNTLLEATQLWELDGSSDLKKLYTTKGGAGEAKTLSRITHISLC